MTGAITRHSILALGAGALLLAASATVGAAEPPPSQAARVLAFDGALGWAAITPGGRGGKIIKVTSLAKNGPGSLRAAIEEKGPRIVVFEVGGVIDLEKSTLVVREPFLTIAGQTAPSPGITLIRGGMDIRSHDIVVRHLRVRPGDVNEARGSGWSEDAIATVGARNVIVDHCSLTWATDENLSASGPRFTGETPDQWRAGASNTITFSHNIIAEGLADSTHPKFEHSKGSLIHDNTTNILIAGNLYAHNVERSALFKGGAHGVMVNNFIYDPGQRAIHYNLQALEWAGQQIEPGRLTVVNNVMRAGPSTPADLPMIMLGGDGDLQLHAKGNIALNWKGDALPQIGRYSSSAAKIFKSKSPLDWPDGLTALPADEVEASVLANAGARPWDRDLQDVRVLANAAEGRGMIIDSQEEVGGYPKMLPSHRPFDPALWNLNTMDPLTPEALDSGAKASGT